MTPRHDKREVLQRGELTVLGRIRSASNATFLCEATLDDDTRALRVQAGRGEQPLWDFPDGTLAGREARRVFGVHALGWNIVPYTIIRHGPAGPGMVQLWIDQPGDATDSRTGTRVSISSTCCRRTAGRPATSRSCGPMTTPATRSRSSTPTTSDFAAWRCSTC